MGAIIIPDTGLQVIASDRVVYSDPTERSGTTKFFTHNFMIPFVGSIRIKFEAKVASGNFSARLYYLMFVGDTSQYSVTITNTSGTEYRTIIKDVPVIPCKLSFDFGPNSLGITAYIRNFQICYTPTKGKLYIGGI